jgi:hypothetical protein
VYAWKQILRFFGLLTERYTETHHLTPGGWVQAVDPPKDRVETWKVLVETGSRFNPRKWWCVWSSPAISRAERDAIRAKYPIGGRLRYRIPMRVSEPLGAPVGAHQIEERASQISDRPPSRWLIKFPLRSSGYWILGLIALALLVTIAAGSDLQHTYVGAYISGKCSTHPAPKECSPPTRSGGSP